MTDRTNYIAEQIGIETERAAAVIDQAVAGIEAAGGDLPVFSLQLLRTSAHLFAETHGIGDLERALRLVENEQQKHRRPYGRA